MGGWGLIAWSAFFCMDGAGPKLPICHSWVPPVWSLGSFVNVGKTRKIGKGPVRLVLVDSSVNQKWSRSLKAGKELG